MKWTKDHDQQLLQEILAERPFEHPKGPRQIGAIWQKIVDNLNSKTEVWQALEPYANDTAH